MFSQRKEKYSIEAYEQAAIEAQRIKELEEKDKAAEKVRPKGKILDIAVIQMHNSGPAMKRLRKLYEANEKEAIIINKEYDRLRQSAAQAIKDLYDFEKDKLGMHKDLEKEQEDLEEKRIGRTIEHLPKGE